MKTRLEKALEFVRRVHSNTDVSLEEVREQLLEIVEEAQFFVGAIEEDIQRRDMGL